VLFSGRALFLAWVSLSGPDPDASATPPGTGPGEGSLAPRPATSISTLVVRLEGMPFAAFASALRLRVPELRLHEVGRGDFEPPDDALYAYALVHPDSGEVDAWSVTVIVSDGRAFFRTLHAPERDANRVAATTVANLVRAAEAGTIEPDASRSMPPLDASVPPPTPLPARPPAPHRVTAVPSVEIGVAGSGQVALGFGPPSDVGNLSGGGGSIELDLRLRSGAAFGLELRGLGRVRLHHRLSRIRVALQGGYVWRRGSFELMAIGFAFAEPWLVSLRGKLVDVDPASADADPSQVLLGGGARIGPGYLLSVGRRLRLHLGARVEASGAGLPRGGVGRLSITRDDGTRLPAFRLGGFELALGVDLVFWIAARSLNG